MWKPLPWLSEQVWANKNHRDPHNTYAWGSPRQNLRYHPDMAHPRLDRSKLRVRKLGNRPNKVDIERDAVDPDEPPEPLNPAAEAVVEETAQRIRAARKANRPVILAFGAHTIKNGLGPVLIRLMQDDWVTLLATNGAGIIHDWEFAYQGQSSEDVRANVDQGQFGIWEETGFFLNLAIVAGAHSGLGYGESVGRLIERELLEIPTQESLLAEVRSAAETGVSLEQAAAALDFLDVIRAHHLNPGVMKIEHPWRGYSAQAAAFRLGIPFTAHPMFGHDIIYCHPINHGAAIGRAALRDFLVYADQIRRLEGGVYLSIGSAVMSPMVFEKSFSMAQNLELQRGCKITDHYIAVVDLAESTWDWQTAGEPPKDNAAYYLRYCKTFSRMGGTMHYASADNRDFLLALTQKLSG